MAVTGAFAFITFLSVYFSFKSEVWQRFALTQTISSRVNDEQKFLLSVGDQGKALSALRPSGKAAFQGGEIEVHSLGNFIDAGCRIKVSSIAANQVYVEKV
jgi:membrane-bound ClpP family serine protease